MPRAQAFGLLEERHRRRQFLGTRRATSATTRGQEVTPSERGRFLRRVMAQPVKCDAVAPDQRFLLLAAPSFYLAFPREGSPN